MYHVKIRASTDLQQINKTVTNTAPSSHVEQEILVNLSYNDQLKGLSPEAEYQNEY
jgi:hypothetical protein